MLNKILNYINARRKTTSKPQGKMPQWQTIIERNANLCREYRKRPKRGPHVLIPTSVGGQAAVTILEGLLGVSLTLRGANVQFLICDGALSACLHAHSNKFGNGLLFGKETLHRAICPGCTAKGKAQLEATGIPVLYFSDFIEDEDYKRINELAHGINIAELEFYKNGTIKIGEHAKAGALRFFARGQLDENRITDKVLRCYFESALLTEIVMQHVFDSFNTEVAVFNHGIYVPHGIIGDVARSRNIRVANWQVAYRKKCFIFSHKETYHHALIDEPTAIWEDISWSQKLESQTMAYLKSRWFGTNDWIWFHDQPKHDIEAIVKEINVDLNLPVVTLLTNVFWDAQLHYKANAFSDMLEWLIFSIEYFKHRSDMQIIIRVHPAEVRGAIPSRQPIIKEIKKIFPTLPKNIFIVPPESQVSTYRICECSNAVIIYGTKTGVETTAMGIPVIVAGEAWIRNKGLTIDASDPEEYRDILERLPFKSRLSDEIALKAKKYAFHFFFRRFIPIHFVEPCNAGVPYELKIESLESLLPGNDKGLDVICNGILSGTEFVYPAETNQDF